MTKDLFKYLIGTLVIVGFFTLLIFLVFHAIPDNNKDLLNLVVGALVGSFVTIVSYHYGSSAGSADKAKTIEKYVDRNK